jgi:hypothetical protein
MDGLLEWRVFMLLLGVLLMACLTLIGVLVLGRVVVVVGDGTCLFRAVSIVAVVAIGEELPSEDGRK